MCRGLLRLPAQSRYRPVGHTGSVTVRGWVGAWWGSSCSHCSRSGFRADRHPRDPTIDGHDPYFNEDEYTEFYTPPDPLPPSQPGDLIRTEPSRLVLEPSGQLGRDHGDRHANHVPQHRRPRKSDGGDGTYFEPYNDWPGQGPRPLIVYGPGTQGQGDQCAPSRQFNQGIHWSPWLDLAFNYEELFVATMVARGFAIVMTDYQGLGTPGLNRPRRSYPMYWSASITHDAGRGRRTAELHHDPAVWRLPPK